MPTSAPISRPAFDFPAAPGAYALAVALDVPLAIDAAGSQPGILRAGRYLYCGSAYGPGGLRARLTRHCRRDKPVRWHIDRLTTRGSVLGAWAIPGGDECELVRRLSFLRTPIAGFGATDCQACRSHLLSWPRRVSRVQISRALGVAPVGGLAPTPPAHRTETSARRSPATDRIPE